MLILHWHIANHAAEQDHSVTGTSQHRNQNCISQFFTKYKLGIERVQACTR